MIVCAWKRKTFGVNIFRQEPVIIDGFLFLFLSTWIFLHPELISWYPRGGTPANSWWGSAALFLKSWPDFRPKRVISDQTCKIHTRFQTWPLGRNYVIGGQINKLFKSISNSYISLSFLLIWNWSDKNVHTLLQFPRKPHSIPDQNGQSEYPFSDQNGAKTLPDGLAHTYIAYLREYPHPSARPGFVSKRLCVETTGNRKVTCLHRECYSMHAGKVIWR